MVRLQSRLSAPLSLPAQPCLLRLISPRLSVVEGAAEVVANSGGAVLAGYLAGAAAGPAVSALAAAATGVQKGCSWGELRSTVALAAVFCALTAALAAQAVTLGATATSLAPPLLQLPLVVLMVAIVAGLVPVTALITGTFFSPAAPFRDQAEREEYKEMQDSYRSDQWQAPKLWTRPDERGDAPP